MFRLIFIGGVATALFLSTPAGAAITESLPVAKNGNPEAAFDRFRVRAATGDSQAQVYLAELYRHGLDVAWDPDKAFSWYLKAAGQGDVTGMSNVGSAYFYGLGVPQDFVEAGDWYLKAAKKGDPVAIDNLGRMYLKGDGVSRDPVQAYMWFTIGARMGNDVSRERGSQVRNGLTTLEIQRALDLVNSKLSEFTVTRENQTP
jgi:uncharacterized protein